MNNLMAGILLLACIIGFQLAMRYWRTARMKRWMDRGKQALAQGDMDAAEDAFRRCVALFPLWVPGRALLGAVLAKQGKLAEAEEQIRMAAELQPREAAGHMGLGMFFATQRPPRVDDAIDAFSKAIECNPKLRERLAREPTIQHLRESERFRGLLE